MSGKIPPEFIDDLLTRVNVVDVINPYVPLRKAGSEYKACCPFHDEKTPSFTVSPVKQFYHCFGCGAHGTAIGFLMEYEHLSFPEAIEALADSIGIEVPREAGLHQGPDHRPLYDILDQAAQHFKQQLSAEAQTYLQQRGLSQAVIEDYQIGYAPPGWDNLLRHLGQNPSRIELLAQSGLIAEKEGKRYDRFRHRIMFPIQDHRGRVIGFGGRVLDDSTPKYLNSPETPLFHKGKELYGLYQAQKALKDRPWLMIVEGYMDVVALAQFNIRNAVATLGTATTADHIKKLFRHTHELIFCFDGDRAGKAAAWKALETTLPLLRDGHQVRFLFLDENEDPDSQIRKTGAEAFLQRVAQATPLSEFLFGKLAAEVDMNTLDGRAQLVNQVRPYIQLLPESVFKDLLQQRLQRISGNPEITRTPPRRRRYSNPGKPVALKPLHQAIALVLQFPQLALEKNLPAQWQQLDTPGSQILKTLLEIIRQNPHLNTAALVEHWQEDKIRQHLAQLANTELMVRDNQLEKFLGCLRKLDQQAWQQSIKPIRNKLRPSDMSEEEKKLLRQLYSSNTRDCN